MTGMSDAQTISQSVTLERDGSVAVLVVDNPPVNALSSHVRQGLYDGIRSATPDEGSAPLSARVLLLSGCQDNQTSMDGPRNGAFTGRLREVWADGAFSGGYRRFLNRIKDGLPPWQSPNYLSLNDPRHNFDRERPFTVHGSPGAG